MLDKNLYNNLSFYNNDRHQFCFLNSAIHKKPLGSLEATLNVLAQIITICRMLLFMQLFIRLKNYFVFIYIIYLRLEIARF